MNLKEYFLPLDHLWDENLTEKDPNFLGAWIYINRTGNFPDLSKCKIAIIGVQEDRGTFNNKGCADAPDTIRAKLYQLRKGHFPVGVADLGNIVVGHTLRDTHVAVAEVTGLLLKEGIMPLIIGGSQDLTYAQYIAFERLEQTVNIVSVDNQFDLGNIDEEISSISYLGKIVLHHPNFLFNYSNIGYQSYFTGKEAVDFMTKLYFDTYRLGQVRHNLEEAEPIIRNADILSVDISSVRQSDAPGNKMSSPNGFYGEEICQIMRYAGMSEKLSSIGIFEINPSTDRQDQTSHLAAQMIWYLIDGFCNRKDDFPSKNKDGFVKYIVNVRKSGQEINFYKSRISDRWWMEVPCNDNMLRYKRHHILPCSYNDYITACDENIPERWWQAYHKMQ